jgi:hypothetical protein
MLGEADVILQGSVVQLLTLAGRAVTSNATLGAARLVQENSAAAIGQRHFQSGTDKLRRRFHNA